MVIADLRGHERSLPVGPSPGVTLSPSGLPVGILQGTVERTQPGATSTVRLHVYPEGGGVWNAGTVGDNEGDSTADYPVELVADGPPAAIRSDVTCNTRETPGCSSACAVARCIKRRQHQRLPGQPCAGGGHGGNDAAPPAAALAVVRPSTASRGRSLAGPPPRSRTPCAAVPGRRRRARRGQQPVDQRRSGLTSAALARAGQAGRSLEESGCASMTRSSPSTERAASSSRAQQRPGVARRGTDRGRCRQRAAGAGDGPVHVPAAVRSRPRVLSCVRALSCEPGPRAAHRPGERPARSDGRASGRRTRRTGTWRAPRRRRWSCPDPTAASRSGPS